jgi:hypothetical protein
MKKLLAATLLALASTPAYAGVGFTAGMGSSTSSSVTAMAPTLDYRGGGWLVQFHAFDLIGQLPAKYLDLGVDVTGVAIKKKVGQEVEGVFMPGGGVTLYSDTGFSSIGWRAEAEARLGAEMKQGIGIGLYVVPVLGVTNLGSTGKVGVSYGGSLQVSAWFAKHDGDGGKHEGRKHRRNKN